MKILENFVSEEIINALGWTLLHSLWQGAIVALLLGLIMIFLNKQSSTVRYFVSCIALLTVFVLSVSTFFSLYETSPEQGNHFVLNNENQFQMAENAPVEFAISDANDETETAGLNSIAIFIDYFNDHLPLIVTLWGLGVLILTLRFMGGYAYVQRLKYYKTKAVAQDWNEKLEKIAQKLHIKKSIGLLESQLVKVPMVIGHLKPVILLPLGTLTGLSPAQLEAILAHELAHIKRNDYLINIFQSLIDILFFFHPAVWWISANVRNERENCCDDIAVSLNKDTLTFAKALTDLEEMNWNAPNLAMALTNKKGQLLQRVQRLIGTQRNNPTFKEGFIAACVLMVSILSLSFNAKNDFISNQENETISSELSTLEDIEKIEPVVVEEENVHSNEPKGSNKHETVYTIEVFPEELEKIKSSMKPENPESPKTVQEHYPSVFIFNSAKKHKGKLTSPLLISHVGSQLSGGAVFPKSTWKNTLQNSGSNMLVLVGDTTKKTKDKDQISISSTTKDGKYIFLRLDNERQVKELFIEGEKIPEEKFMDYQEDITRLIEQYEYKFELARQKQHMVDQKRYMELAHEHLEGIEEELENLELNEKMRQLEIDMNKSALAMAKCYEDIAQAEAWEKLENEEFWEEFETKMDLQTHILQEQLSSLEALNTEKFNFEFDFEGLEDIEVNVDVEEIQDIIMEYQEEYQDKVMEIQERALETALMAREKALLAKENKFHKALQKSLLEDGLISDQDENSNWKLLISTPN
ncbi:M56 family metallopeptidase [Flexithrix dorotheae]|uniref:M56 family metallopeptidase n=1 Tax=Flexithrix dorotheae TaxID=70993 RepID=UPI00036B242B|nr:M56 family metallopeptidase [Flexithrix dorotheae]